MLEYEKYQELQTKSQKMQEDYERQLHVSYRYEPKLLRYLKNTSKIIFFR